MNRMIRLFFLGASLLAAASVRGTESVPALHGRVNDYANKLSTTERNDLENELIAAEKQSSNQIAILVTPSLGGDSIEDYAQRVFHEWRLGQKGLDNGVLIVWAPTERKIRIHTGYGLEGKLTDAVCSAILRNDLAPSLKAGKGYEGLRATVASIVKAVKGEYKAPASSEGALGAFSGSQLVGLVVCGIIALVLSLMNMKAGAVGGGVAGLILGLFAWPTLAAAVLLAIIGVIFGALSGPMLSAVASGDSSSGGGWGGDGGGDSGSSDFSGGGGDSGGGGASSSY